MILKKINLLDYFLMCFLNGCAQNAAFLGPAYTLATTGNIYQAGFLMDLMKLLIKLQERSTTENIKVVEDSKKSNKKKKKIPESKKKN